MTGFDLRVEGDGENFYLVAVSDDGKTVAQAATLEQLYHRLRLIAKAQKKSKKTLATGAPA